MKSTLTRTIVAVGVVTLAAGVIRFWHLGRPDTKVFDEVYYASDGCWFAGIDFRECGLDADVERSWVHPPLGKMLIGFGIDGFGNRALGWRVSSAAAGTATVAIVGALGYILWRRALWASVAALLLAVEHLHFVQSRIAMIDVFMAMFVALGFLFLVADRRRQEARAAPVPVVGGAIAAEEETDEAVAPRPPATGLGLRPLRLASGAAFGAAIASKWSGILGLVGAFVLALVWERTRKKDQGHDRPFLSAVADEGPGLFLAFVAVPIVVYLATWIPWVADRGWSLPELFGHHVDMARFHFGLSTVNEMGEPIHPYMSSAWGWLLLTRPVAYFWNGTETTGAEILGIANPVLFWGALVTIPYLAVAWRLRRDWRAGAALVPILAQYLPWLAVSRPLFLFYMTPVSPFLALGTTYLVRDLGRAGLPDRRVTAPVAGVLVAAAVGAFVFFWPVLVGDTTSLDAWRTRMWFRWWI